MNRNKWMAVAVLMGLFAVTAALGLSGALEEWERALPELLNPQGTRGAVLKFFTDLGEAPGVIGVTAVFLLLPPVRRRVGAPLSVTVISSWLLCTGIKYSVRRARPALRLLEIGGYSFPSGHAMNNAALYVGLMLLLWRLCRTRTQRAAVAVVCLPFMGIIGLSRLYFNVHYLSDVICGWCLGSTVAILLTGRYFRLEDKKHGASPDRP